jgi:geranylgeranyl pyrophosphate synthase
MRFEQYYEKTKRDIDKKLEEIIGLEDDTIKKIFKYATEGGKRFRPTLTVLCSDVLGGDREKALTYAAVIEFTHTSSLAHDDIIDCDIFRRKKPTLWRVIDKLIGIVNKTSMRLIGKPVAKDNITLAVLAGDGLLAKSLYLLDKPEAVKAFGETVYALLLGAVKEAKYAGEYISKGLYYDIIVLKTASLFATACYLGALTADVSERKREALRLYGKNLGILYQLVDDYIDEECPEQIEANIENEIREYIDKCLNSLKLVPRNTYREALEDAVFFMLEKFSYEGRRGDKIREILESLRRGK